jgi:hypothetical protein
MLGAGKHIIGGPSEYIHEWTMDCNANAFAYFDPPFLTGGGGGTDVLTLRFFHEENDLDEVLLSSSTGLDFKVSISASNSLSYIGVSNVTINGLGAPSDSTELTGGYYELLGTFGATSHIAYMASNKDETNEFKSQIHYLSIDVPLVVF